MSQEQELLFTIYEMIGEYLQATQGQEEVDEEVITETPDEMSDEEVLAQIR